MKQIVLLILLFAMLVGIVGCAEAPVDTTVPAPTDLSGKYLLDESRNEAILNDFGTVTAANSGNARVYYQIFVGSFSDSNGDGIGDLRGIINRFDYLNDGNDNSGLSLGVEGIWLSPIFTSPSYHKYDATNYYEIDPKFGTMEDLKELIDLCHSRNVQIILDLVINHSSSSHSWFKAFCESHRKYEFENEYYEFYNYTTDPTGGKTWHTIPGTGEYYEGNFSGEMPELNYDNENVRQAMVDLAKFYLDMGVDGFRFDAAKYIYYGEESRNADFWVWYMAQLRAIKPDIYTVAEVWDGDGVTFPYFASTNCFNFSMAQANGIISQTVKSGDVDFLTGYVGSYLQNIKAQKADAMLISFIANHDTDRAAGFLTVASGDAKVAANLTMLLPGSPFIYYGEEIGMKGARGGANTDANRRLAMLWGDNDTVKNPIGANYTAEQVNGTVADQLPDGNSLYNHYKKLIAIRKANPEVAYGDYQALEIADSELGGFLATYNGSTAAVLHNVSKEAITIDLSRISGVALSKIAASAGVGNAKLEGTVLTIDGQTSVVLK